jgi:DNA-3-methyladenine glycosylase
MSIVKLSAAVGRHFFERPPDDVASDLVGTWLVVHDGEVERRALIVETEAYGGIDDPASHSFRGPTKRSAIMFGPAGFLYVYLIYGMHWCMNIVTERSGTASAVLLRGAELVIPNPDGDGETLVALRGPGNLTRGLGITGDDTGLDCCGGEGRHLTVHRSRPGAITLPLGQSKRIGITREIDRPSRYFLEGHAAVSKVPTNRSTPRPLRKSGTSRD